ncbi:hypothetical protein T484DRAFT_1866591 [Baffinella frigidus]|nr:hypothetical protein T484DRAFT_1866591 [Cryptophyta sp. CCMP2293]
MGEEEERVAKDRGEEVRGAEGESRAASGEDEDGMLPWSWEERREEGEEVREKEIEEAHEKRTQRWLSPGVLRPDVEEKEEERARWVSSGLLRPDGEEGVERCTEKEESWLPERTARAAEARAAMILASRESALVVRENAADALWFVVCARVRGESEGDAESLDLLRRMLRLTGEDDSVGAPWISRGDVFHSASALSTTVLDPSATTPEKKAVASSSQLVVSCGGGICRRSALSNQFPPSASGGGGGVESRRRTVGAGVGAEVVHFGACIVSRELSLNLRRILPPFYR